MAEVDIKQLYRNLDEYKVYTGWIRSNRAKHLFLMINDGSCFELVQVVYDKN